MSYAKTSVCKPFECHSLLDFDFATQKLLACVRL